MKFAQSVRNGMYKLLLKGAEGGRIEELTSSMKFHETERLRN